MKPRETLLLTCREVAELLTIEECIAAVERAFKLHGGGNTTPPGIPGVHARDGAFHIIVGNVDCGFAAVQCGKAPPYRPAAYF